MAVVVQQMIASERLGCGVHRRPHHRRRPTGWSSRQPSGQGEVVVSGSVEPDTYIVAKDDREIVSTRLGYKSFKIVRGPDGTDQSRPAQRGRGRRRVLNDDEVRTIAELAVRTERHDGCPAGHRVGHRRAVRRGGADPPDHHAAPGRPSPSRRATTMLSCRACPPRPGEASGTVRVLLDVADGGRAARWRGAGGPDDQPGLAAHHAPGFGAGHRHRRHDLPRRHRRPRTGVPCIVGARTATTDLKDGTVVTVDGTHGRVLAGRVQHDTSGSPTAPVTAVAVLPR